ncbi:MAG: hypothetical protein GY856_12955, partial [bacterium]|nr:hypothetical protein [bacterium]
MYRTMRTTLILVVLLAMTLAGTVQAQVQPERSPEVAAKAYRHADLDIQAHHNQTGELPAQAARQAQRQLARLGVHASSARVDRRSGRFSTLLPATPLVPGNGVGNTLSWMAEPNEQTVRQAFTGYLEAYQAELKIDLGELADARVVSHGNGTLYQIYVPRTIDGIAVRGSYITAVVNHGNLVLFGAHQWGDRGDAAQGRPQLNREEVQAAAADYVAPLYASWGKSEQIYVPMARGQKPTEVGGGYHYQLVWALRARLKGDAGSWEALVDAYTGEVLAFEDLNQYAEVKGGVLPVTNDGIDPDGVEQGGSPMPYQDTTLGTTDTGGNVAGSGSITATFYGPYVNINDNCG